MLDKISTIIWGPGLLALLLGTGLILSFYNHFFQLHGGRQILRQTFGSLRNKQAASEKNRHALTQLQTFSTALAAAMGTGNILGVATALLLGGPGAIFWMWISAFLGMMLTYTENLLAQHYAHTRPDGTRVGGPMAYLHYGLNSRILAALYAIFCIMASFGMGNMTQSSAISTLASNAFSLPPLAIGILITILLSTILLRGAKGVGGVLQWLMPILAATYMFAALAVILRNLHALPAALTQIFRGAWGITAIGGGVSGAALRRAIGTGLRHGVFSNEAGLGSSALVHASGASQNGQLQGFWSIVEVALDTLVCCTLTALAILTSNALQGSTDADAVISAAFSNIFGDTAPQVLAVLTALFAFCTLIGWCCCGEQAIRYLFSEKAVRPYRLLFCLLAGIGAVLSLHTVWTLSDIANGLMAIPNLLGILLLYRCEKPLRRSANKCAARHI